MGNVCVDPYSPDKKTQGRDESTGQQRDAGQGNRSNNTQFSSAAGFSGDGQVNHAELDKNKLADTTSKHGNMKNKSSKPKKKKNAPPPRPDDPQGHSRPPYQDDQYNQERQGHMRVQPHHLHQVQHLEPYNDQQRYERGQQQGPPHGHVQQVNKQQREQSREDEINSNLRQNQDMLQKKNEQLQNQNAKNLERIQNLETDTEKKDSKIHDLERNLKLNEEDLRKKDGSLAKMNQDLVQLQKEKEELLNRLSAMAGAKLTDNNPNITDLSDENRPTKIAERFGELYDNQWTDAFSEIGGENEEKIVTTLLNALIEMYKECDEKAKLQLQDVETAVQKISMAENNSDILKPLKDNRKKMVKQHIKELEPVLQQRLSELTNKESKEKKPFLENFLKHGLKLCWLMVIQDPPVFMDCNTKLEENQSLDKNKYKPYTVSGKIMSFTVWPALYLHENGPILSKGVAQCKSTKLTRNPEFVKSVHGTKGEATHGVRKSLEVNTTTTNSVNMSNSQRNSKSSSINEKALMSKSVDSRRGTTINIDTIQPQTSPIASSTYENAAMSQTVDSRGSTISNRDKVHSHVAPRSSAVNEQKSMSQTVDSRKSKDVTKSHEDSVSGDRGDKAAMSKTIDKRKSNNINDSKGKHTTVIQAGKTSESSSQKANPGETSRL